MHGVAEAIADALWHSWWSFELQAAAATEARLGLDPAVRPGAAGRARHRLGQRSAGPVGH